MIQLSLFNCQSWLHLQPYHSSKSNVLPQMVVRSCEAHSTAGKKKISIFLNGTDCFLNPSKSTSRTEPSPATLPPSSARFGGPGHWNSPHAPLSALGNKRIDRGNMRMAMQNNPCRPYFGTAAGVSGAHDTNNVRITCKRSTTFTVRRESGYPSQR